MTINNSAVPLTQHTATFNRDLFTELVKTNFHGCVDKLFDKIEAGTFTDSFHIYYWEQEVYLTHLDSIVTINWYKLTHIGRSLTLSAPLTKQEIEWFLKELKEELNL